LCRGFYHAVLKQNLTGPAQMDDLRRLKARLEGAMKITEGELQRSVFKCVDAPRSSSSAAD
jgi:hypothetical protein